ncbi:MAG TPA: hypothetical protein VM266_00795 [Solirubrobacteraceae bacterium]|nr:hypothetical protein [Solirubrobacteraceae bacterium]
MPLQEVEPGMRCTGYSVIRGTEPEPFDVEIVDVLGDGPGARLLVRVSGPAVDRTGIGAGFSGSPIYCRARDGRMKNAGAISETIGDFGGKTVLATPIEEIIATPVEPPTGDARASRAAAPAPRRPAGARRLSSPLTIGGVRRDIFRALAAAARRRGIPLLPASPLQASGPGGRTLRPGSAVGVGLSSGAVSVGAIGTVAYVDGDRVWAFGHQFDGTGRRSLLLQDAYVAAVINNPVQLPEFGGTYKLAGAISDVGTVTSDGFSAVAGRTSALPATIPVRVIAQDLDTGEETTSDVAVVDETDVGNPSGASALAFVAPLAISDAATGVLGAQPARLAGEMCLQLRFRERRKPVRICNRYVADGASGGSEEIGNVVALSAASDAATVISLVDAYKGRGLHVTELVARVSMTRGQRQAYMRRLILPRRVRRGQRVPARLVVQRVRGRRETVRFRLRIPNTLRTGARRITLRGRDADTGGDLFGTLTIVIGGDDEEVDTEGPRTVDQLARAIRREQRWDGIRLGKRRGPRAFRHGRLRIGGRASAVVRVVG